MDGFDAALATWQNFFGAQVGAGATLLGLLFVGLSMNLTRILADPLLPVRAEISLLVLVLQIVVSLIALLPHQPATAFAVEVIAVAGAMWAATTAMNARIVRRSSAPDARRLATQNMILLQVATAPYLVGGALLLGGGAGLPLIAFGTIMRLVKATLDSWVLLVEINR